MDDGLFSNTVEAEVVVVSFDANVVDGVTTFCVVLFLGLVSMVVGRNGAGNGLFADCAAATTAAVVAGRFMTTGSADVDATTGVDVTTVDNGRAPIVADEVRG